MSAVIFGLGGVGSHLAYFLSKSNDNIKLVDFDVVEEKNLARQLYSYSDIGKPKAVVLRDFLLSTNPKLNIEIFNLKVKNKLDLGFFNKASDVAFICTDNIESKRIIASYFPIYIIASCEQDYFEIKTMFDSKEEKAWVFRDGYNSTQTFNSNIAAALFVYLFWVSYGVTFDEVSSSARITSILDTFIKGSLK